MRKRVQENKNNGNLEKEKKVRRNKQWSKKWMGHAPTRTPRTWWLVCCNGGWCAAPSAPTPLGPWVHGHSQT